MTSGPTAESLVRPRRGLSRGLVPTLAGSTVVTPDASDAASAISSSRLDHLRHSAIEPRRASQAPIARSTSWISGGFSRAAARARCPLGAYALLDPEVRSCQGMAVIAAVLLMVVPGTQSFQLVCILTREGKVPARHLLLSLPPSQGVLLRAACVDCGSCASSVFHSRQHCCRR